MSLIGCFTWCVGGCECLSQSQYTCCPVQRKTIAIDLNINIIVVGVFIKVIVQTFNAQLWERFTDHQRVKTQQPMFNPYWTGRTYMSIPGYWTGRTYMSLCCNIIVASLWCSLEHYELGGAKKILHCGQWTMCSWSMVNNEENWLPWQIKECLIKKIKKSPQKVLSPWDW